MTQHWSDEAYSKFYASSYIEKSLVNKVDVKGSSKDQLNKFQQAFAEWSGMRRGGLRFQDFRPFLLQLGVDLLPNQARSLWKDFVDEGSSQLSYDQALLAYLQVIGGSVNFSRAPGSARPVGEEDDIIHRAGVDAAWEGGPAAAAKLVRRSECEHTRDSHGGRGGDSGKQRGSFGLGLLIGEARDFLLEEGLYAPYVETFLQPYLTDGAVPQSDIFDFLAEQNGAEDESSCNADVFLKPAAYT
jgi:hypothetical protein